MSRMLTKEDVINNTTFNSLSLVLHIRGMIKNNVDFCYKKLYSQHRLIQTIPFCFGNCLGSENKIFVLIFSSPEPKAHR